MPFPRAEIKYKYAAKSNANTLTPGTKCSLCVFFDRQHQTQIPSHMVQTALFAFDFARRSLETCVWLRETLCLVSRGTQCSGWYCAVLGTDTAYAPTRTPASGETLHPTPYSRPYTPHPTL
eukprot:2215259-Rhodomonas_salina.1